MPDIQEDSALMKMEVAGICGTDVKMYKTPPSNVPVIMGHENIGIIAKAGREFTRRKGFKEGDVVFVEHYVMCGKCEWCHIGQYRHCENTDWRHNPDAVRYGYTSAEQARRLWGGLAQYVYLPWNAVVHRVPKGVTPELAGLVTPMANGVEWSLFDGGVSYDSSVLIQGPGQQGLSQTVICKIGRASCRESAETVGGIRDPLVTGVQTCALPILLSTSTCRGTPSCTACRRASRRSWRDWSRRWPTASNGRCSTAGSAMTPACSSRARASRGCRRP